MFVDVYGQEGYALGFVLFVVLGGIGAAVRHGLRTFSVRPIDADAVATIGVDA